MLGLSGVARGGLLVAAPSPDLCSAGWPAPRSGRTQTGPPPPLRGPRPPGPGRPAPRPSCRQQVRVGHGYSPIFTRSQISHAPQVKDLLPY
jgi:hypothetical protein